MDEENTKRTTIDPLLLGLGWDLFGEDVRKEYEIVMGTKRDNVDYALLIKGIPKIFIEAKRLQSDLSDAQAKQVLSYGAVEKVRWCVLTNGKKYKIYNSDWGRSPDDAAFCSFDLDPDSRPPRELVFLSKEYVERGDLDNKASKSRVNIRTRAILSDMLQELTKETIRLARNMVYKKLKEEMPGDVTRRRIEKAIEPILEVRLRDERRSIEEEPLLPGGIGAVSQGGLAMWEDGLAVVCPSKPKGVEWMHRHSAWGYVRIAKKPKYLALYLSWPNHAIKYIAEVEKIMDPVDPDSPVKGLGESDQAHKRGKKVILLKKGSIRELEPGIPLGEGIKGRFQNLRYTTLGRLKAAKSTDDI